MDDKNEKILELLLGVVIIGILTNYVSNFLTPYLDFATGIIILALSTTVFMVLILDLHKMKGGVKKTMRKTLTVLATIAVIAVSAIVVANVFYELRYPTTGEIAEVTLTVTWLNGTEVTSIGWGATENNTAYLMEPLNVTNTSNVPVNLTLSTATLSPSIITLSLTWNYTGNPLQPDASEIVELCQNVTATGPYSYETVIAATES